MTFDVIDGSSPTCDPLLGNLIPKSLLGSSKKYDRMECRHDRTHKCWQRTLSTHASRPRSNASRGSHRLVSNAYQRNRDALTHYDNRSFRLVRSLLRHHCQPPKLPEWYRTSKHHWCCILLPNYQRCSQLHDCNWYCCRQFPVVRFK